MSEKDTGAPEKNLKGTRWFIAASMVMLFGLCLGNITAGLPSERQTMLVFGNKSIVNDLTPVMKSLRDEIYTRYRQMAGNDLRKFYRAEEEPISVVVDGSPVTIDKRKINAMRTAALHMRYPDEPKTWAGLARVKPEALQLNTHLYHYGGLYVYSVGAAVKAASMLHLFPLSADISYYFAHSNDLRMMYVIPRIWGILVTVLGIPIIFFCTRRMYGQAAAYIAAVSYVVIPCVCVEAHFLKPYAFSLPLILLTAHYAFRFRETGSQKKLCLSAFFAGLGTGTLLLNGVFVLCPLAAIGIFVYRKALTPGRACILGFLVILAFGGGFVVSNPHWLFTPGEAWSEMTTQSHDLPLRMSMLQLLHHFIHEFHKLFTVPLYLLIVSGLLFALWLRSAADGILLAAFVPYYLYIANQFTRNPHYAMPLVPFALILGARSAALLGEKLCWRQWYRGILLLVMLFALSYSLYYDWLAGHAQQKLMCAGEWINANIPGGATIGTSGYPYFGYRGYPPFALLNYRINEAAPAAYYLVVNDDDPALREKEFAANYRPIASFNCSPENLFFKNHLLHLWRQNVRIYARSGGMQRQEDKP